MYYKEYEKTDNLIRKLECAVYSDKISHAYIFEGPGCIDKKSFAESFAKGVLCPVNRGENCGQCSICSKIEHENHEDIMYLSAEGSSVKDAAIIRIQEKLKTKPLGERHIVIIEDSDTMTRRAQNRLLKTLEEPPGRSIIILLSENMENLLPTVLSRCVKYRINYSAGTNCDSMMDKADRIAELTLKREPFYKIKKEMDNIVGNREEAAALLDELQMVYRNMLLDGRKKISLYKDKDLISNIHSVETARKQIKDGISPTFAMKDLILKIGGQS